MNLSDPFSFFMPGTNGQAVLLVHGMTGAPAEMRLVGRLLNRRGFTVYAPLLAGHGESEASFRKSHWRDWLDSVDEAAEKLKAYSETTYAAGICVGGKLALLSAHRNPGSIKAVALYSPCFHYDGWGVPFFYPFLSRQIGWLAHVPFLNRLNFSETPAMGIKDDRLRRLMTGMSAEGVLEHFPGTGIIEMYRLGRTFRQQLPAIRTPTLILHAREDDLSNPRQAEYIARHLGAPNSLHWIEDSYHMIHVDRQHRSVADFTASYFEGQNACELV
ncbi:carboxylesterase [Ochrobactrum sp. 19YEA23]|uniref:alpha/beta hydrolase n=1 Tax=Ochrobactrum sp. 19YEA23 TaxID=3039854 RepID=UPI002479FD1A|nr:carboxylesterase [Ochrobactrum sp. 19YEA23]